MFAVSEFVYFPWDLGLSFLSFGGFFVGSVVFFFFTPYFVILHPFRVSSVCSVCLYVSAIVFMSGLLFFIFGAVFWYTCSRASCWCIPLGSSVYSHCHLAGLLIYFACAPCLRITCYFVVSVVIFWCFILLGCLAIRVRFQFFVLVGGAGSVL